MSTTRTQSLPAGVVGTAVGAELTRPALRRLRWAVRATLTLGVIASVAANVLHARPNPISQTIAAWPPCALLMTIELIARVPVYRRMLAALRLAATAVIAGIAAWISYTHMAAVAAAFGEVGLAPRLLPISVDGLVIVASVSLVELTGRVRVLDRAVTVAARPSPSAVPPGGTAQVDGNRCAPSPGRGSAGGTDPTVSSQPRLAVVADLSADAPTPILDGDRGPAGQFAETGVDQAGPGTGAEGADVEGDDVTGTPSHTADAVVYWLRRDPTLQPADIAAKLGRSKRTVRRYWPRDDTDQPPIQRVNGHRLDRPFDDEPDPG